MKLRKEVEKVNVVATGMLLSTSINKSSYFTQVVEIMQNNVKELEAKSVKEFNQNLIRNMKKEGMVVTPCTPNMSKTQKAVALWNAGKQSQALAIFKTFKLGLTKEEQRSISIAHECINCGKGSYYTQLDVNIQDEIKLAGEIITSKFINKNG